MKTLCRPTLLAGLALAAGCSGVDWKLDRAQPVPHTIAVLPFAGTADPLARDTARGLVAARLAARGYAVAELPWVDRVLSERQWLRDPRDYMTDPAQLAAVRQALGVDAVLTGGAIDESQFQFVLLRRHTFGGDLAITGAAAQPWWRASHRAGGFGGLLVHSGQVFTELQAQASHGTPMATLALVDQFVEEVVDTLPVAPSIDVLMAAPRLADVRVQRTAGGDATTRVEVAATAPAGASVRFDLGARHLGVPMAEDPQHAGSFRGACDAAAADATLALVVHARDAFGLETTTEVRQ